ncbi:MAG TPA: hypothetical protein VH234_04555 [Candidatus Saccharimonadales bacterium]|jgi:hypothetical protein|nr:hypothetical protein [Candidatus Saccharimonadales bacterium]
MADSETTTIRLDNDIRHNSVLYPAGSKVTVPKASADDISRMDHDFNVYKDNLHKRQDVKVDAGEINVGSQ